VEEGRLGRGVEHDRGGRRGARGRAAVKRLVAAVVLAGCHAVPLPPLAPRVIVSAPELGPPMTSEPPPVEPAGEVRWLKGNTHLHAAPSGDSIEPIANVLAWYRGRGYDFIVQTDHNRVTDIDKGTPGHDVVHDDGLLVIAGSELTYNPEGCDPAPPDPDGKCRIHLNLLGVTARPRGKFTWPHRDSRKRLDQIARAYLRSREWGGLVQLNHPSWHWGAFPEVLAGASKLGVHLFEIANAQFAKWNAGDATHPSLEAAWDEALTAGATLYGVASDDAHDYDDAGVYRADKDTDGFYPAGGGWVMVRAARDASSILDALARGDFYASSGVTLARVEIEDGALVVEIAADDPGAHTITFVGDGAVLAEITDRKRARQPLDAASYVRAVVTRDDGAKAWVQPVRR